MEITEDDSISTPPGVTPSGVFGADIIIHLNRSADAQSPIERVIEAMTGNLTNVHIDDYDSDKAFANEQRQIALKFIDLADMVLAKNRKYQGAALNAVPTFAPHLTPGDKILVRMDDKLSRIRAGAGDEDEDPYADLVGYLVLMLVGREREAAQWDGK